MDVNILGRIDSILSSLPKAEKKIATVILNNPESVLNMTATVLGKESNSSAATVIRFCKRIGIPSFTQLKILLSSEVSKPNSLGYSDITEDESAEDILDKILGNTVQSLQDTISILNTESLTLAIEAIEKASILYVFGVGASFLVAENIAQKFNRIGKTSICYSDPHNFIPALVGNQKNACFIGISNSGETKEVIRLLDVAAESNLTTISMTRFGTNSLSSNATVSLQTVRANEEKLRSAATYSLHAQFLVVDVLFFMYASKNYKSVMQNVKRSRNEIEKYNSK